MLHVYFVDREVDISHFPSVIQKGQTSKRVPPSALSHPALVWKAFDKPPRDKGSAARSAGRSGGHSEREGQQRHKWPLMMWAAFIPCKKDSGDWARREGGRNHILLSTGKGEPVEVQVTKSKKYEFICLMGKRSGLCYIRPFAVK